MNNFQAIYKARCEKGFVAGMDHAGKAVDGVFRGTIYLFMWMFTSAANALRLLDEHTSEPQQQLRLDEVA
jgi:hypothetical protein